MSNLFMVTGALAWIAFAVRLLFEMVVLAPYMAGALRYRVASARAVDRITWRRWLDLVFLWPWDGAKAHYLRWSEVGGSEHSVVWYPPWRVVDHGPALQAYEVRE